MKFVKMNNNLLNLLNIKNKDFLKSTGYLSLVNIEFEKFQQIVSLASFA